MAFFIAEFLYKVIKEEESNQNLFNFVKSSLLFFDEKPEKFSNFHLIFLAQLTGYFGFQPQLETYQPNSYFNLQDGDFSTIQPNHPFYIGVFNSALLNEVFELDFEQIDKLVITKSQRKEVLSALIDYYSIHVNNLSNLKSRQILEEIFS